MKSRLVTGKTAKTAGDVWSFTYDHLNRLTNATLRNSSNVVQTAATYAYDVFGNRIEKKVDDDGDGTVDTTLRTAYLDNMAWLDFDAELDLTMRYMPGDAGVVEGPRLLDSAHGLLVGGIGWRPRRVKTQEMLRRSERAVGHDFRECCAVHTRRARSACC